MVGCAKEHKAFTLWLLESRAVKNHFQRSLQGHVPSDLTSFLEALPLNGSII